MHDNPLDSFLGTTTALPPTSSAADKLAAYLVHAAQAHKDEARLSLATTRVMDVKTGSVSLTQYSVRTPAGVEVVLGNSVDPEEAIRTAMHIFGEALDQLAQKTNGQRACDLYNHMVEEFNHSGVVTPEQGYKLLLSMQQWLNMRGIVNPADMHSYTRTQVWDGILDGLTNLGDSDEASYGAYPLQPGEATEALHDPTMVERVDTAPAPAYDPHAQPAG